MVVLISLGITDIAGNTVKGIDYCCINSDISKIEAMHLFKIYVLNNCRFI